LPLLPLAKTQTAMLYSGTFPGAISGGIESVMIFYLMPV
jgi:hypothetical protein